MNLIIKKFFSIFLIMLLFSFSHSSSATTPPASTGAGLSTSTNKDDPTTQVICNIIRYVWSIGGPLMTVVIIGAALMAIFGRMPWPALFALGMFCAVFFGAKAIVNTVISGIGSDGNKDFMDTCGVKKDTGGTT